jgi:hypothetical protein
VFEDGDGLIDDAQVRKEKSKLGRYCKDGRNDEERCQRVFKAITQGRGDAL